MPGLATPRPKSPPILGTLIFFSDVARWSVFGMLLRAANGLNLPKLRSENTHLAPLNSVFRALLEQILAHYACELALQTHS